jgi:hypothetical protein
MKTELSIKYPGCRKITKSIVNEAGIKVVLDIAIRPAPIWLHQKYPSVSITDASGDRLYPNHRLLFDFSFQMVVPSLLRCDSFLPDIICRKTGLEPDELNSFFPKPFIYHPLNHLIPVITADRNAE